MVVPYCLLLVIVPASNFALSQLPSEVTRYHKDASDANQLTYNNSCTSDGQCPTWYFCENTTKQCKCGKTSHGMIKCDKERGITYVLNCYCVTHNEESNSTQAGLCFYNCDSDHQTTMKDTVYHLLPTNPVKDLNSAMCGRFNRTGVLCGKCNKGLYPFVLSYNFTCVECPDGHKNWWKFILAGFVPLTFFYLFVMMFNINITSSHLRDVVLFSQVLSVSSLTRIIMLTIESQPKVLQAMKVVYLFYSFWNLDFFRSIIPDICLHVSTLEALALDYVVAVYPIILITISYVLIELYDHNIRCIVYLWKPFYWMLSFFRRNWNIRTSVIDSSATFFLLLYVKILSVSSDLLMFTSVYNLNGTVYHGVYYDSNVTYFGREHLPYAILATFSLIFIIIIPTVVLVLYPFQFFQRFLSCFPIQWHFLHAFVDSFQGSYKDGTQPGTRDCRWFAQFGLFIRLTLLFAYASTLTSMYFVYALVIVLLLIVLHINVQPFKRTTVSWYSSVDPVFLLLICIMYTSVIGTNIESVQEHTYLSVMVLVGLMTTVIPIVYIMFLMLHWIYSQRRWGLEFLKNVTIFKQFRK